jgi:hypothetical protein
MNRIHPKNAPLLELPQDHPARAALVARLDCQRECAGREIAWPGREDAAADQEWRSSVDGRTWRFSALVYSFVCFDLILSEWIDHPPRVTEPEEAALAKFPEVRVLLDECEAAARHDRNATVLEMIPKVRRFFSLWEQAIRLRIEQDGVAANAS